MAFLDKYVGDVPAITSMKFDVMCTRFLFLGLL